MEINQKTSNYLIALLRAMVRQEQPAEKPEEVDWKDVLNLARYHQVDEMIYDAVKRLEKGPEGDLLERLEEVHRNNQLVHMFQQAEAKLIIEQATKGEYYILPLKGALMKKIYPNPLYRQMGDLDYLVEEKNINDFVPLMKELGYEAYDVGLEDSHDVYKKRPYIEVEIHRRLLPPTEENHWYTDDIWERLVPDTENPYLLHMTLEDYYLFHLLHFEKHYSMGGSGIRSILDQYYLMKAYQEQLDWNYINEILPKFQYVEFEKMCRDLAECWFGEGTMTEELKGPAEYIINSGVFGNFEQYQKWSFERYQREQGIKTKKGYFFRRMFMERERMEFIYPSIKKHGWLLPFCWIHRLFKSVFCNWGRVKMELKHFQKKEK
ncbi:MAG: nucleotidyltransferase family protein [Eubacterium sp.]|nr:nucleotidyltransferase family protein [Eubacterium sp.]